MAGYGVAVAVGFLAFAGAALAQSDSDQPRWMANIARHQLVMMRGVPQPYSAARDPTPDTPAKLRQGAFLFDRHCAACHGISGQGSGPDAFGLIPPPADLNWLAHSPADKSEAYMYWSIAEGGERFGSEMPAFEHDLADKDIWSIIAYIRAGYPQ
jgi:mono/diheme cytochrome c family protein